MRKALVETATGRVANIVAIEADADYVPPDGYELVDAAEGAEPGGTWDGAAFLPAPEQDLDAIKELQAQQLLSRAVDETFLQGHYVTLTALSSAGITTGIASLDAAVAAGNPAAFRNYFIDNVKQKL